MAIAAAIALEQVRTFLRVSGSAMDEEIALMIAAATAELETITATRLISQPVAFWARSFADLYTLPVGPIASIEVISYTAPTTAFRLALSPGDFRLTGNGLDRGIASTGAQWPAGKDVHVEAIAGYGAKPDDVPPQLRWALLAMIRGKFEDRPVDIEPLIVNHRIYA